MRTQSIFWDGFVTEQNGYMEREKPTLFFCQKCRRGWSFTQAHETNEPFVKKARVGKYLKGYTIYGNRIKGDEYRDCPECS